MRQGRQKRGKQGCAGFTLTEVMIASAVLVLFMGGFLSALIMGLRTLDMSVNHYRANAIARNRVQRARSFDYDSLVLLEESNSAVDRHGTIDADGSYRRSTEVATNTPTAPHTVRIRVGVQFPVRFRGSLSEPVVIENIIAVRM